MIDGSLLPVTFVQQFIAWVAGITDYSALNRDSPDAPQTGVNTRVFPSFLQDGSEDRTASVNSDNPNRGRGADLAIFADIWTHFFRRQLDKSARAERFSGAAIASNRRACAASFARLAIRRNSPELKSVRTANAWPMANDPPFATLNHFAADL